MGRAERRKLEKKIKHMQKTKPWELQAMVRETYARELIESRLNKETLAPGDKVVLDVAKITKDVDWPHFKPEYQQFVIDNADKVFTLRKEARQQGPWSFVSFEEDTTDPRWLWFTGFVKKVKNDD